MLNRTPKHSLRLLAALGCCTAGCMSEHNPFAVQTTSCDVIPQGGSTHAECHEFEILHSGDVAVFKSECAGLNAPGVQTSTYNDTTGCDLTGAVAGCQDTGPPKITVWFYAPYEATTVQAICMATVVMP